MDAKVYGFALLVFAVGTYFSLVRAFDEYLIGPRIKDGTWPSMLNGGGAKVLAAVVVVGLWFLQDRWVHHDSPEAQCCHAFEEVLADWDGGRRREAIDRLNQLSTEIPPWEPDQYADGDEW